MAYMIVLCCALLHMSLIGSDIALRHTVPMNGTILFSVTQAVSCLLYPLLGWMADVYFTRYKFVLLSFITMILGSVVMAIAAVSIMMFPQIKSALYPIPALTIVICFIGIGLFESTAIQFGMDQMLEASSDKLSTFIHWYYWSSKLGSLVIICICYAVLFYFQNCIIAINEIELSKIQIASIGGLFSSGLQLVCAGTGLCLLVCYKRQLNIDRTGDHPLKLIYQVLKYAWKHKCPENRSAFTYWEEDIPPRIDLGKNKYGGPFTTEEVEDTKTFLRILILFLSLLGFHLSGHGYSLSLQLASRQCPSSLIIGIFVADPMNLMLTTILIGIPLYQLMVRNCRLYAPNMLKRMGLGLLCCLVKVIVELVIHATMTNGKACKNFYENFIGNCFFILAQFDNNGTCSALSEIQDFCPRNNLPFLLMIIPNILQGFAFILVFMTTFEFICAQAPLRLKGLLIGIWYASLAVYYLPVRVSELFVTDVVTWEVFYEVKAFLIFLSLILFMCVSKWYRYRVRDEVVNEQFLVEEIYERELALAEEYEKEQENICVSIHDYGSFNH